MGRETTHLPRIGAAFVVAACLVPALLLSACGRSTSAGATSESAPSARPSAAESPAEATVQRTGIEACDKLVAALDKCIARSDGAKQAGLKSTRAAYARQATAVTSEGAKQTVSIGCQAELDALGEDCE